MRLPATYLLAGGPGSDARQTTRLLATALRESGAGGRPVAYIGAASGDNPAFLLRMETLLTAAGAGATRLAPSAGGPADAPAARRAIAAAGCVFVSGGDVEAGMLALQRCGIVDDLARVRAAGVPFIGLSAGSIMLARAWIAWDDPADDASARLFTGLAFAPVYCDTHAEEEGWQELRALLRRLPEEARGYGIGARAMLRVEADGAVAAYGGDVVECGGNGALRRLACAAP